MSEIIVYCNCAYSKNIADHIKSAVLNGLKNSGLKFEAVPDLCELAARRAPELKRWSKAGSIKIIACYPRTVKWLFDFGQAPLQQDGVEFLNMRVDSAEKIISSLAKGRKKQESNRLQIDLGKTGGWVPWFPVIDYDRCQNCKQCLNFCLFGVYELSKQGSVRVAKPANCKTNCPACARICPQTAIIFPKYEHSPINGDEPAEESSQDETTRVDLGKLLSGDIRQKLRQRGKGQKRFAPGKASVDLEQLKKQLDIPSEVIASLSSSPVQGNKIEQVSGKAQDGREEGKCACE